MMKQLNIGLFGLGTVGQGVIEQLGENQALIKTRAGLKIQISKAVTQNPDKKRRVDLSGIAVSGDPAFILDDPSIDLVLELIGGTKEAKEIVLSALEKGKSVVTANKALLAEEAGEIFQKAYQSKGLFGFEASVAGGIPILRDLREGFSGERITAISGIINGTANYILTQMSKENKDFATALKEAQEAGYAEADPTFDIEGVDTAHKLLILMKLAFNGLFNFADLYIEGITNIEPIDIEVAQEFGFVIKLLGTARAQAGAYEGRVHPCLVEAESMLGNVNGAFNAVEVFGNFVGHTLAYGSGAGSHPTSSAVVGDIISIARQLKVAGQAVIPPLSADLNQLRPLPILPMEQVICPFYLRFTVADRVGVLAEITRILGAEGISIGSMLQKERSSSQGPVPVIIFTHKAKEEAIRRSLKKIDHLEFIAESTKVIRLHEG